MSVEKMYFINVSGPLEEIDNFVLNSVIPLEIQLVKAFSILDSVKGLISFESSNKYDELLKKVTNLCNDLSVDTTQIKGYDIHNINIKKVEQEIDLLMDTNMKLTLRKKELEEDIKHKEIILNQIIPLLNLDFEIEKLFDLKYFKYRYGKMPKDSFNKMKKYSDNLDLILYEVNRDENDVYLMYFMPNTVWGEIDTLFASLFFTRIRIDEEAKGCPKENYKRINEELISLKKDLDHINDSLETFYKENFEEIIKDYSIISKLHYAYSARSYLMHSKESFYLTGWIPHSQLEAFENQIKEAEDFTFIAEEIKSTKRLKPPTKLRNNSFFKPFESFVSMYGTPSYNEIDPTIFVGITYLLMFGIMFGDIGQGLVIGLLGYLLYKKKKAALGKIGIYIGITSAIAGTFYGSIFGNEEILREHLSFIPMINPMEHKTGILLAGIGFGVVLIIIAMILNIINSIKTKDKGKLFFDKNGIVGIIIYFSALFIILAKLIKLEISIIPATGLIVISLVIILISHPLQELIDGKKDFMPKDKKGYFIEAFFELVETVLAILSNTISFMRVGAFALNHVGLVIAFHMLSDMVGKPGNLMVMIIGNILIIALEGLIVGIQGLRLEYYELFSRFFEGNGVKYKPFYNINKQN